MPTIPFLQPDEMHLRVRSTSRSADVLLSQQRTVSPLIASVIVVDDVVLLMPLELLDEQLGKDP